MELTYKPYDKQNEINILEEDENRLFKRKFDNAKLWKSYVKKYKYTQFLRVFFEDEFVGLVCYGIKDKLVWDKKGVYYNQNKEKDYHTVIKNVSWLYAIALEDKFKNKGLSHKLMKKYETESKKHGAKWLGLHVLANNNAKFLYKSENFKEIFRNKQSIYMIKKLD